MEKAQFQSQGKTYSSVHYKPLESH